MFPAVTVTFYSPTGASDVICKKYVVFADRPVDPFLALSCRDVNVMI